MDIADWRDQIDEIDTQVLHLLNRRAEYSIAIGDIKFERKMPVYSPEREARIIERMVRENPGPLSSGAIQRIYERIIDESRKVEKDECQKRRSK